jgi:drug/metabolite transporter (DMT)-like permease
MAAIWMALGASLCFSLASQIFRFFSHHVSPYWMNHCKAWVATLCFGVSVVVFWNSSHWPTSAAWLALALSGILGLAIGDIFLMRAYRDLGPGRTLFIFGFQPLFIGLMGFLFLGQSLDPKVLIAVLCLCGCVVTLSFEAKQKQGHWGWGLLGVAGLAAILDASGLLLTRWAFDHAPKLQVFEANFVRCLFALLVLILLDHGLKHKNPQRPLFWDRWKTLGFKLKALALVGAVFGTYLSLTLWLKAVSIGHLATITAIAGSSSPLLSNAMECVLEKRTPSLALWAAVVFFLIGFSSLTLF